MKSKAEICGGICGFHSTVLADMPEGSDDCSVMIESRSPHVQTLAVELKVVRPFEKGGFAVVLEAAAKHCRHAGCPVAVGIIKAVEVAAGLALPGDVTIKLEKLDG